MAGVLAAGVLLFRKSKGGSVDCKGLWLSSGGQSARRALDWLLFSLALLADQCWSMAWQLNATSQMIFNGQGETEDPQTFHGFSR